MISKSTSEALTHHPVFAGVASPLCRYALKWAGSVVAADCATIDLEFLTHGMALGENLSVLFQKTAENREGQMFVEFSSACDTLPSPNSTSLSPSQAALSDLMRTAFPGCIPVSTSELTKFVGLPISYGSRQAVLNGPKGAEPDAFDEGVLGSLKRNTVARIRLPLHAAGAFDVGNCLKRLLASDRPFALKLALAPVVLTAQQRNLAAVAAAELVSDGTALMRDPAGFQSRLQDRMLLGAWAAGGLGWRAQISLDLPGTLADRLFLNVAFSEALGVPIQDASEIQPSLDLSDAIPQVLGLRGLLPPVTDLRAMGFLEYSSKNRGWKSNGSPAVSLGTDLSGKAVSVPRADLGRHMLIVGATGTGKSTLLRHMIRQDIAAGIASVIIDPHGDLVGDLCNSLGRDLRDRLIVWDLASEANDIGLDLLAGTDGDPALVANRVANDLTELFQSVLYADSPEAFGPMWASYFRNGLALLMLGAHGKGERPDLCDFDRVYHDVSFRKSLLAACADPNVVRFWTGIALRAGGEASLENLSPYIVGKFTQLTGNPRMRKIISGKGRPLDMSAAFDGGQTILINLAKGTLGATDAAVVGALITARILRDLLARCTRPRNERPPTRIYLDEVQTFASSSIGQLLAEGRKAGAEVICCSQDLTSFGGSRPQPRVAEAILSNVGHLLSFRVGVRDAALFSEWFAPDFGPRDLMRLPDQTFAARVMAGGLPQPLRLCRVDDID